MPRLAPDHPRWRLRAPPVCIGHAAKSGVLIGNGAQWPLTLGRFILASRRSTAGGASFGARCRPRLVLTRCRPISYFGEFPRIRPSGTSTNNWSLGPANRDQGSRLHLEWIAPGFTAQSFWSARTVRVPRWKVVLVGCGRLARTRLTPNRCLAGFFPGCKTRN